jgi:hypothetical protein
MSYHQLQTIPITWPFSTWGLDLVVPFKKAKWGFKHIFVAVDKFTKWIKVKSIASIKAAKAVEFIQEIMYMFGRPNNIITDIGSQFTAREFKEQTPTLKSTMTQCHTRSAMVKWSAQMAWSFRVWSLESLTRSSLTSENWLRNCHQYCGPFVPPRVVLWVIHHSL